MKKNILKKIFVKIIKSLGFEIIDQNEFRSPTLNKDLNQQLSSINKSIILPLGEVNLTRKISSLLIIFRTNSNIEIWDQNKKRIFEKDKIEYIKRSLNSLIKAVKNLKENYNSININIKIVDDNSTKDNLAVIKEILDKSKENFEIINHNHSEHLNIIKEQKSKDTFSNLSSLLKCFEIGKNDGEDLIYFIEDDYLHFRSSLEEMVGTYERIASQLNKDLIICPSDYPYLYMNNEKTNLLIGSKRHWRTINKSLCSFMTSKNILNKYWDNFYQNCLDRHDPFEKYLNLIYEKEVCISPVKSLSIHMTNINSSYGLSPFINYKSLWEENE
ncbi:glycosyltransferase [Candidatus Pelagibacter sp.]|nr:glycosyltransferase [Candidatus Pelagibacter sp.]